MTDAPDSRISINGFSKESVEMIRELESFGWVFRRSNHGVVGHAPNDKTTISISRSLNKSNRGLKRAQADFRRWLKMAHPEMVEVATEYIDERERIQELAETDPISADILRRRVIAHTVDRIDTMSDPMGKARLIRLAEEEANDTAQIAQTNENGDITVAADSITTIEPMHFKKSKDDIPRVLRRTWTTGKVDFACAFAQCLVTSTNARSVAQHYGAVHTRPILTYVGGPVGPPKETVSTPAATETEAEGLPWEALAETVEELRGAEVGNLLPPDEHPVTKQMVDEQHEPLSDAVHILMEVQALVSSPLLERVKILAEQVNTLTKERDEAREHLAKIQSDWDALRSLLGNR